MNLESGLGDYIKENREKKGHNNIKLGRPFRTIRH